VAVILTGQPLTTLAGVPCSGRMNRSVAQFNRQKTSSPCNYNGTGCCELTLLWLQAPSLEEDEDVRLLRAMEEEEERRQEEERLAFLAEREAKRQQATVTASPPEAEQDELSEDEDDWLAEMREAELEEEQRQEAERLEWIAKQAASS